jgi:hypothetical protein
LIKAILLTTSTYHLPSCQTTHNLPNNTIPYQFGIKGAHNRRLKYFKGKEDTPQPRILANPSTLLTLTTKTNSDLARLIFKPDIEKYYFFTLPKK